MRRRTSLVIAAALAAAGVGPSRAAAAEPRLGTCAATGSAVRPATVTLACADAGAIAHDLVWTGWGQPAAAASGTLTAKTCDPDCATGGTEDFPVSLTADRLETCADGSSRYTRITYAFPGASPYPPGSPGADDPTVVFPCPLRRPSLDSLRVTLTGVGPAGARYYVRVRLRVRYCAPAQRKVDIVVDERTGNGGTTFARRTRSYARGHTRGGCRTAIVRYRLADEFFGVGTYSATVRVSDTRGQTTRRLVRRYTTVD